MIALQGKIIKRLRNYKSFEIHITSLYVFAKQLLRHFSSTTASSVLQNKGQDGFWAQPALAAGYIS